MHLSELDFELPPSLIAQTPATRRDHSRLLLVDRRKQRIAHHHFYDLPGLIPRKTYLFRNNAAVFKARLPGRRPTGGKMECFLLRPQNTDSGKGGPGEEWECLLKPARKLPVGSTFQHENHYRAEILEKKDHGVHRVRFTINNPGESVLDLCAHIGSVPLPPYIQRHSPSDPDGSDEKYYQTVYADPCKQVAAAAPTAGLHFTPRIIHKLEDRGNSFHDLTLHVGLGTFQPITSERIEDHIMHHEHYEIPAETRQAILGGPSAGYTRLAVGTTSVRSIEDFLRHKETAAPGEVFRREAALFLAPPSDFHGVDALLTNFHLPRSTLLCLVAAFLDPGKTSGLQWLREIYAIAIREKYRFFSYGDAMLIL